MKITVTLCMKYKTRIKDRPFVEGSRGCHALFWLDAQNLNAKERHFILPLVIWTFIMKSVAFISSTSQDRIKLIFSTLINHTYLLEGSYSIHRYIWWALMAKLGLRIFGSTSSISTWCKELASMREKGKLNMLDDPWQYTLTEMSENINHYVVFLVQHQLFSMSYLMSAHNYKRCPW